MEEIATPAIYDQILDILAKKSKTPFERFVTNNPIVSPWSYYDDNPPGRLDKNRILDGKASWYIRHQKLPEALFVLQQIPDSFWKKEPYSLYIGGDPFYLNVNNAHVVAAAEKLNLNKKEVIQKMIRLEKMAKTNPKSAGLCYFQLANAWYNMTWFGKNWLITKQWWSVHELFQIGSSKRSPFNDDYYGCRKAKEYYLMAVKATKENDLAILSCFMAGKCENNFQRYQYCLRNPKNDWYDYTFSVNPYKSWLRMKGADEDRYDKLVKECALYLDFISRYNRVL